MIVGAASVAVSMLGIEYCLLLTAQRIVLDTIGFLNESVDQRPVGQFTDEG